MFSVTATGTATLHYEWRKNGSPIPGAPDSANYTIASVVVADAGSYSVRVSNSCGEVISNAAVLSVNKASATVTLGDLSATYDCNPHSATATTSPPGLTVDITYDGSNTPPTNAGDYTVVATINDPNYSGSATDTLHIAKADASISVSGYSVTYNCLEHIATGTAKGACDENLNADLDFSGTAHTNAVAAHTDTVTFTDPTGNYNSTSRTVTDEIKKANATIDITPYNVTYDHNSHTATGTATGVCNDSLSGLVVSGTTHTNPGDYNDSWTFTDITGNYNDASGTLDTLNLAHDIIHFGLCSGSGVILQPINANGTSVFPRSGRTVPVKFWVCDASGNSISDPSVVFGPSYPNSSQLKLVSAVRGVITNVNETADNVDVPNAAFRFTDGQWIFNMATTNLQSGMTYYYTINLGYGSIPFSIGIK
jgi:hypothetical protein